VSTVALTRVRKSYDEFVAVDDLSFAVEPGRIYGLLGPNGAGKTSTIRMMIGITYPDAGEIRLFGESFRRAHMRRIGYLPEERGLYRKMKVLDQLVFLGELKGLSARDATTRSLQWCERLALKDWTGNKVEELSKGMQQKVQFIGALLHDPDLIVLDEPFSGLDPSNALELKDIILEFEKAGKTVILSTHRMDQAERLCDSICLINHGQAVLQGDLRDIKSRYGHCNAQIRYDGSPAFLADTRLVANANNYGNYVEVHLAPGADPQDLLRAASAQARITRFEVMEPSLEEIFIEAVSSGHS
jgi:ABC-2 type transport system ATP-binding protein